MAISDVCPSCKATIKSPDEATGRMTKCPGCGRAIFIGVRTVAIEKDEPLAFDNAPAPARRKKAATRNGGSPAIWISIAVAALIVGSGITAAGVYFLQRPAPAPPAQQVASKSKKKEPEPSTKKPFATTEKADLSKIAKDKFDEERWRADVTQEYIAALKARENRMIETQERLGRMNQGRFEQNRQAASVYREMSLENRATAPDQLVQMAAEVDPQLVRASQRENLMRSPEYAELVRQGKVPARLPIAKRRAYFERFAAQVGIKGQWSLGAAFDDLNEREMEDLMQAVDKMERTGFRSLDKGQRLLFLQAGADEFFRLQVESFK